MSREYYYFVASLPLLEFDSKPLTILESFLSECQRILTEKDFFFVQEALNVDEIDRKSENSFVSAWHLFERRFSNELVYFRAGRLHKDPNDFIKGERAFDPHLAEIIQQALKMADLLTAEKMLDKARWLFLDELLVGHYFDVEAIVAYALKLKILERQQTFLSQKGQEQYQQYKQISLPEAIRV